MEYFWNGFEKRAADLYKGISKVVGAGAKGGKVPIPGMRTHAPSPNIIPGHGAVTVSKKMSIKPITQHSKGMPETAV